MSNKKLAIIGATGLVGRTILTVLAEKKLPIDEYAFFASKRSSGKTIKFLGNEYVVQELTAESFNEGFDYAIFSAGSEVAKKFAPIAVSKGCIVIDNSSCFRMDENVPLVVPEVNPEDIAKHKGIIANPNCSTIQAVAVLKPLDNAYSIKRIVYSTYQAVSGAGYKGVVALENGTFKTCLPHIDVFLDNGYTKEEEKMINETRKILKRPDLKITATAVRVPILNCHSESINVQFEKDFDLNNLENLLKNSPNIIVKNAFEDIPNFSWEEKFKTDAYPTTLDCNGLDKVFVGRIRKDFSIKYGVNLWVVADNLRKGAATNAIQILEKLI